MRLLLACLLGATACVTSSNPEPGGGGSDNCVIDPATSEASIRFATTPSGTVPETNAWVHGLLTLDVGWSNEDNTCVFAPDAAPTITVDVTTSGVTAEVTKLDTTSDPITGTHQLDAITPTITGSLVVHVATTNRESGAASSADQTYTVRVLDDIELHCRLLDSSTACGTTLAKGTPFMIEIDGVSSGKHFSIAPRMTWNGASTNDCSYDTTGREVCTFASGATAPVSLTAALAGTSRTITVAIE